MSYKAMLKHRCAILRQDVDLDSGSPLYDWVPVATNIRCFVDLNFIRHGKDDMWTPEAGRPTERAGVGFFLGTAPIKNGDWIKVTKGPAGVFEVQAAVDEAWRPSEKHHLEVGLKEIPAAFAAGTTGAPKNPSDPIPVPVPNTDLAPAPIAQPVVDTGVPVEPFPGFYPTVPVPDPDDERSL